MILSSQDGSPGRKEKRMIGKLFLFYAVTLPLLISCQPGKGVDA